MVPKVGLEPTRRLWQRFLRPLRLPIPPFRHINYQAETRDFQLVLASGYSIVQTLELNQFHFALYWNLVLWNPKTRSFTEE